MIVVAAAAAHLFLTSFPFHITSPPYSVSRSLFIITLWLCKRKYLSSTCMHCTTKHAIATPTIIIITRILKSFVCILSLKKYLIQQAPLFFSLSTFTQMYSQTKNNNILFLILSTSATFAATAHCFLEYEVKGFIYFKLYIHMYIYTTSLLNQVLLFLCFCDFKFRTEFKDKKAKQEKKGCQTISINQQQNVTWKIRQKILKSQTDPWTLSMLHMFVGKQTNLNEEKPFQN